MNWDLREPGCIFDQIIVYMSIRIIPVLALFALLSTASFGQRDTAYQTVALSKKINDTKIAVARIGEKALIYVGLTSLMDSLADKSGEAKKYIDSALRQTDTVFIDFRHTLQYFEYSISKQLIKGNALVFSQKQQGFVDTIFHRYERYGEHGDRFFYLPDKRPFFSVMERSGILDPASDKPGKHYQDYLQEGKKLASLREY
jgi:hypothetical protein